LIEELAQSRRIKGDGRHNFRKGNNFGRCIFAFFLADNSGEPTNFNEAYNYLEPDSRVKWRVAICKEFEDMKNKGEWGVIPKKNISEGRRCVKTKWVFKIKRNGIFRAILVVCGFSQVPGIDFTEIYAPVINDVSIRITLVRMMVKNLKAKIIDLESACLHSDLEESIYMEISSGMEVGNGKCLVLKTTIYELVQSVRQFYVKLVRKLNSCRFTGSLVDPWQWVKQSNTGILMMAINLRGQLLNYWI
jgi:hypothetical protein